LHIQYTQTPSIHHAYKHTYLLLVEGPHADVPNFTNTIHTYIHKYMYTYIIKISYKHYSYIHNTYLLLVEGPHADVSDDLDQ